MDRDELRTAMTCDAPAIVDEMCKIDPDCAEHRESLTQSASLLKEAQSAVAENSKQLRDAVRKDLDSGKDPDVLIAEIVGFMTGNVGKICLDPGAAGAITQHLIEQTWDWVQEWKSEQKDAANP